MSVERYHVDVVVREFIDVVTVHLDDVLADKSLVNGKSSGVRHRKLAVVSEMYATLPPERAPQLAVGGILEVEGAVVVLVGFEVRGLGLEIVEGQLALVTALISSMSFHIGGIWLVSFSMAGIRLVSC